MLYFVIGLIVGIVITALSIFFLHPKNHTNGVLEIHDKGDDGLGYKLILFDPIEEWGKKKHLRIRVTNAEKNHS